MRYAIFTLVLAGFSYAQPDAGFTGSWRLNPSRSQIRPFPIEAAPFVRVEQSQASLTVSAASAEAGPYTAFVYPLDDRTERRKVAGVSTSTETKWEGAALLTSILVSGPDDSYTVMERWTRSRDGNTLTVKRTIVRPGREVESLLVYESPSAPAAPVQLTTRQPGATPSVETPVEYTVDSGTRILLRLTNSLNTKHSAPGDRVYLETAVPIFAKGRPVIPRGSYVIGTVVESKQAGRVKGKSELSLQFDSLTLPNGASRDLRSRPGSVDIKGNLDRTEGKIEGEGNKGGDARTVGKTTAAGAGIGAIAAGAAGAGIGAAAGAAAGLAGIFGSRGPDVTLPPGTSLELVLDRDLRFTETELGRAQ